MRCNLLLIAWALWLPFIPSTHGAEVDLAKIERKILRVPTWRSDAPRFCLLVFSPRHRVWLAVDGDDLYADLNGNGDLTEPDEKRVLINPPKKLKEWDLPDVPGEDNLPSVTRIRINPDTNRVAAVGQMFVFFTLPHVPRAFVRPQFAESLDKAPIVYPTGPQLLIAEAKPILMLGRDSDGKQLRRRGLSITAQCYVDGLGPGTRFLTTTPDLDCQVEVPAADGQLARHDLKLTQYTDWGSYRSNNFVFPSDFVSGTIQIRVSAPLTVNDKCALLPFAFQKTIRAP